MTDIQILTLALTLLGIFIGSWFNNSRIGDVNNRIGDLNNRIQDTKEVLRAEMKAMQAEMNVQFERINNKIDTILKLVADHDQRLSKLEGKN